MGIFNNNDDDSNTDSHGCPIIKGEGTQYDRGTSHNSLFYTTAACAAITFIASIGLMIQHFRRYRAPKEQRQIVKIIFAPVAFALVGLGCVSNYHVAPYVQPLGELYEAFALVAVFLMLIQFAVPGAEFGEEMFHGLTKAVEQGRKDDNTSWPKTTWVAVFQYPVLATIALIVLEGTTASGTYCAASLEPKFGHLWYTIIKTLGVVVCFISIIRFYGRMKQQMKVRRTIAKLAALKGLVILTTLQTWIFSILLDKNVIKTSAQFSYGDLLYGIPNTVIAVECVLFSCFMWWAYSSTEYSSSARPNQQPKNFVLAIFDAMNPADLVLGVLRIPLVFGGVHGGGPQYGSFDSPTYALVGEQGHGNAQYGRGGYSNPAAYQQTGRQAYSPPAPGYDQEQGYGRGRQYGY